MLVECEFSAHSPTSRERRRSESPGWLSEQATNKHPSARQAISPSTKLPGMLRELLEGEARVVVLVHEDGPTVNEPQLAQEV